MASPEIKGLAIFVILGDAAVMEKAFGGTLSLRIHGSGGGDLQLEEDAVNLIDPGPPIDGSVPGQPDEEGSRKALRCLDEAVRLMLEPGSTAPKALVTAPLSKERIAAVHPGFVGHTEYLQEAYSSPMVTMVMAGESLCVVPVTRHIPLKEVAGRLTQDLICRTLTQVIDDREVVCGIKDPLISVCALNPHSGEGGKIGREEIEVISPAVRKVKGVYPRVEGPVSADVAFYKAIKRDTDIVIAMYHDQGLAPFKMVDFDTGVNMTLGLGHVRTSPDHGTAFDIAGRGAASSSSMERAIKLAARAALKEKG